MLIYPSIPFSSAEDAKIKRCPMCRVPIERNDGCAQMMCKRCKHVFCWYCLQSLDVSHVHQIACALAWVQISTEDRNTFYSSKFHFFNIKIHTLIKAVRDVD